jgi:hypothetical protein
MYLLKLQSVEGERIGAVSDTGKGRVLRCYALNKACYRALRLHPTITPPSVLRV